jgi:transaldolase
VKIFIDTANIDEIREVNSWGVLDGVTTNPSLIAKEGRNFIEVIAEICEIVDGPVSAEVIAQQADGMLEEAHALAKIHDNVVIKVPFCAEGLKAVRVLSSEGLRTNVTLCFSANQALLAAKAGASYISPFVGRLDDQGQDGMDLIADIVQVYDNYFFETEVLVASVRHPGHFLEAARLGAHVSTVPFGVLKKLLGHTLTDKGNKAFLDDWSRVPGDGIIPLVDAFLAKRG